MSRSTPAIRRLWRLSLQVLTLPPATVVLGTLVIVLCPFDRSGRLFLQLVQLWSRLICFTSGVRLRVRGRERLTSTPATVFVSNHASLLDPPALILTVPVDFRFIAKRSLFLVPVFGQAMWAAGIIPIDRGDRNKAIRSMNRAAERIRDGRSVLVFAEGTRSSDGRLQRLKKGAFILAIEAGVPVQPVVVRGSREVLPKGAWLVRPGTVTVEFLEPVPTDGLTFADRDTLRERVGASLRAALDASGDNPSRPTAEPADTSRRLHDPA